jgi:hypothetical protein
MAAMVIEAVGFEQIKNVASTRMVHISTDNHRYRRNIFTTLEMVTSDNKQRSSKESESEGDKDLTGHKLWVTFTGFDVVNMNFGISFEKGFSSVFSRGLQAREPGLWRVVNSDDGKVIIEITQPLLPDYLYFFNIWESSILWRGELDIATNSVNNGKVVTNKKRFGLFTYQDILATWSAVLLVPDQKFPDVNVPKLVDQTFAMPQDFDKPRDMERYPEIFAEDYVSWMCDVEDATIQGYPVPNRPQNYFVPEKDKSHQGTIKKSGFDTGNKSRERTK